MTQTNFSFDEYQEKAEGTAIYPGKGALPGLMYAVLGMVGEAGEFANAVKKIIRDKGGTISSSDKTRLIREIGDVLWYASQICTELGVSFSEAAITNLVKLNLREMKGTLQGSGDNR